MPLVPRDPNGDNTSAAAHTYPIARSYALLILVALVILFALRQLFGSVKFEAGVR